MSVSADNGRGVAPSAPHIADGPRATETSSTNSEADEVDENVYNELVWFCIDNLVPACEAHIALQKQLIRDLTKSGYVAMYAWRGAVDHFRSFGFWDSYEKLSTGLGSSPMAFTSYAEIAECVLRVEGSYNTFCGQTHLLSNEGKFNYKRHATTASLWEEWRTKHNAMVTAYEKIKRDSRFGKLLFRPVRESRWGGIIEPLDRSSSEG